MVVYGAGGEPDVSTSGTAVDGDSSLLFSFPGGNWGGGYFDLDTAIMDMSSYANGSLVFSVNKPIELQNAEIKIESPFSSGSSVFDQLRSVKHVSKWICGVYHSTF